MTIALRIFTILLLPFSLGMSGCSPRGGAAAVQFDGAPGVRAVESSTPAVDPVALIGGRTLGWADLWGRLAESSGAAVLEEIVLDEALKRRCEALGIAASRQDVERERVLLLESLDPDPDVAARLLAAVRARDGLGSRRFEAMLWRNARLRALVRDDVRISPADVRAVFEQRHGERFRVRLITAPTLEGIRAAREELESGRPFHDVAAEHSTDVSAARGGLLAPISVLDPTYPEAVRDEMTRLEVGEVSGILPIEGGFALIQLVERIPADGRDLEEVRAEMERLARLSRERFLMASLTREILDEASVVVMDAALAESWERRRRLRQ